MDNRKEVAASQCIELELRIPPGDFRNVEIDDRLQMRLSHDLSEFMESCKGNPSKFYIMVKFYLSERKGLHRCMKSTRKGKLGVIEASMNATLISLMTLAVNNQMNNVMNGGEFEADDELRGCIEELKNGVKSKDKMIAFDKFCSDRYGVTGVEASVEKSGEGFSVDNHLQAES
tara:strand:+ start:79 stop:600 length:522 start_codon:yes stop_codon:yes gene_type:complete